MTTGKRAMRDLLVGYSWDWRDDYAPEVRAEITVLYERALTEAEFLATPLMPTHELAVRYAQARAGELLSASGRLSVSVTTRERVRELVTEAIKNGDSLRTLKNALRQDNIFSAGRAETIARTETSTAMGRASIQAYTSNGYEGKEWRTSGFDVDNGTDGPCVQNEAAGAVRVHDSFPSGDDAPPAHPRCLPGYARVSAAGVTATSERRYDGDLVVIRTTSGKQLPVTPNHPILTPTGWQAAGALEVGAHVISSRFGQWMATGFDLHNENMPASIEHVAEAFRRSEHVTAMPVPLTAEDFHGDGAGSEVAVVWADRLLGSRFDTAFGEPSRELALAVGDVQSETLHSEGTPHLPFDGFRNAPFGGVSGAGETLTLIGRRARHAREHGLGAVADRNTAILEAQHDGMPRDSQLVREILDGAAGEVFADQVIDIERTTFHGMVYNLETVSGAYVAEGIITHNCRCTLVPVFEMPTR